MHLSADQMIFWRRGLFKLNGTIVFTWGVMFVLVVGSAAAGTEFKLVEVLVLAGLLTVMCVALFIWALGLPYPLFAGS